MQYVRETEAAADLQSLRDRIDNCAAADGPMFNLSGERADVQSSFEALVRLGCRADAGIEGKDVKSEPTDEQARAFLQTVGRKATEESARQLLVQLGLWTKHENLELIRTGMPVDFARESSPRLLPLPVGRNKKLLCVLSHSSRGGRASGGNCSRTAPRSGRSPSLRPDALTSSGDR